MKFCAHNTSNEHKFATHFCGSYNVVNIFMSFLNPSPIKRKGPNYISKWIKISTSNLIKVTTPTTPIKDSNSTKIQLKSAQNKTSPKPTSSLNPIKEPALHDLVVQTWDHHNHNNLTHKSNNFLRIAAISRYLFHQYIYN